MTHEQRGVSVSVPSLCPHVILPGGHHIRGPRAAQVLGHLIVDLLHGVAAVRDQHLLPAQLYKLHKATAGHFTLG